MNKKIKFIVITAVAIAVFAGIYFLYGILKENYTPEQFSNNSQNSSQTDNKENSDYKAPDFTVFDEEGNEVNLSDYAGKPVVINFWASWCHYCKVEMPDFNEAYHNNPDIQFLMINVTDGRQETMNSAKEFLEKGNYDFPVFYDKNLNAASTYGASGLPMTFFVDKNGNLVTYAGGMLTAENLAKGIEMIK